MGLASVAHAQPDTQKAWQDFEAEQQALESASTQDCATACKALESLARAAQHICEVAPEHCDEAKAKLRAATDRVHAACPQCEVRAQGNAPPVVHTSEQVEGVQVSKSGGCAGCTTAGHDEGRSALALILAALLARRRRHVK